MNRLLVSFGLPTLQQVLHFVFSAFERVLSIGGVLPVALGALLAYILLMCRRRPARG